MIFHLSVPIEEAIKRNTKRDKFGKETDDELRTLSDKLWSNFFVR